MTTAPRISAIPFHILAKPAGADCNLACKYCFYLEKGKLYQKSSLRMSDEVLTVYIKQLVTSQTVPEVSVAWQGGEPTLMGLDFFERSVDLVNKIKRPDQQVSYTLQTNGTLLDDEWCTFFKRNDFLIGLSCDGPAEMHDAYRVDKGGKGSFRKVKHGWDLLQKHQVDTNILCTVNAANGTHAREVYLFFRDNLQARYIQFIPIVEWVIKGRQKPSDEHSDKPANEALSRPSLEASQLSERSVKPKQYGKFLCELFDEWVKHDVGTVFIQMFDSALASWYGFPASICVFQEACGRSLVMEHNGDLYSCDHFVDREHRLGNILEKPMIELVNSPAQQKFELDKYQGLSATCRNCEVRFACQGECPRNRLPEGTNGSSRQNYLCEGYRLFFQHIDKPMRKMANLLRQGRSAAEIVRMG